MAKSSPTRTSKPKQFLNSALLRSLVVVLIIGLVMAANAISVYVKHDKYRDARRAADTFLTAYTSCDLQTARKYYLAFQTNDAAVVNYQKECHKGDISFSYDSPGSYSDKNTKGLRSINLSLNYNASQKGGKSAKFIVYMLWSSKLKEWTVSSIGAAPATSTAAQSSAS